MEYNCADSVGSHHVPADCGHPFQRKIILGRSGVVPTKTPDLALPSLAN